MNVEKEARDGFGPLKATLEAISAVRADSKPHEFLLKILLDEPPLQETTPIRNKIEDILSRIAVLEAHLATLPDCVAEQRRRNELIEYVIILLPLDAGLSSIQ